MKLAWCTLQWLAWLCVAAEPARAANFPITYSPTGIAYDSTSNWVMVSSWGHVAIFETNGTPAVIPNWPYNWFGYGGFDLGAGAGGTVWFANGTSVTLASYTGDGLNGAAIPAGTVALGRELWVGGTNWLLYAVSGGNVVAKNLADQSTRVLFAAPANVTGGDWVLRPGGYALEHVLVGLNDWVTARTYFANGTLYQSIPCNTAEFGDAEDFCFAGNEIWAAQDLQGLGYAVSYPFTPPPMDPGISQHPSGTVVIPGSDIYLSVTASGTAPLMYQWRKNGLDLSGEIAESLVLTNAQTSDSGDYSVLVTNQVGGMESKHATVWVGYAPGFVSQPSTQSNQLGQTVTFSVVVTGTPPISLQWRKDGAIIGGATNASLVLTNAQSPHSGNYSVLATSHYGSASSSNASLYLTDVPFNLWQGLVAYYPLEGNYANVVGTGNNAEPFFSPVFVQGRIGQAIRLDGEVAYLECPVNLNNYTNLTIAFWANLEAWPSYPPRYQLVSNDNGTWGRVITVYNDGRAGIWNTDGAVGSTTNAWPLNEWRHLIGIWSPTATELYVNGKLAGVGGGTLNPLDDFPALVVGAGLYSSRTKGMMDELRVYSKALSSEEAADLYELESVPLVNVAHSNGLICVAWRGAALQSSTNLADWQTLTNASQTSLFAPTNAMQFFRVLR